MGTTTRLLFFCIILLLSSCSSLVISDEEKKGIEEVAALYGGTWNYGINRSYSSDKGNESVFTISMAGTDPLTGDGTFAEMYASNIAYIMYTHIKAGKRSYQQIVTNINKGEGQKATYEFPLTTLEKVDMKMNYAKHVAELVAEANFEELEKELVLDELVPASKKEALRGLIAEGDSAFGKIGQFRFSGFQFMNTKTGKPCLRMSGNLKRSRQDSQFSVFVNAESGKNELYAFDFNY
ncbi:MAG: hypothetical protein EOO05_10940 [Chitinophagaceae bacterium]|nr:MAG: hypothetical protein EOO05_10940 [Chitinophagaceae bacterium]